MGKQTKPDEQAKWRLFATPEQQQPSAIDQALDLIDSSAPIEIGYESSKRAYAYMGLLGAFLFACAALAFARAEQALHSAIFILPVCVTVALLGFALFHRFRRRPPIRLTLSKEGLSFTGAWQIELLGRMNRSWKDVHTLYLTGFAGPRFLSKIQWESVNYWGANPQLQLVFRSGGSAHIKLPLLTRAQATTVLEAISLWCDPSRLSADVVKLKEALLAEDGTLSFTQLWSQDLELRHGSTHFVPLSPGMSLQNGNLRVIREVATGGLSAVYLAQDHHKRKVVLKESVLPLDMKPAAREKARELFAREAKLLMKLQHRQIACVYDQFIEDGRDYLVLDYVPGKTLRQIVSLLGPQPEEKVLDWFGQIARILQYLHEQTPPIVHRDITPDNIMVKDNGELVLVDFGAANEYLGTATGTMIGKQSYIPPEQFRGKATPQSDIYSLGGTMFFALTAQDPLPLASSDPLSVRASLSQSLAKLIVSCTEPEAADRLQSASLLAKTLTDQNQAQGGGSQ